MDKEEIKQEIKNSIKIFLSKNKNKSQRELDEMKALQYKKQWYNNRGNKF